MNPADRLIQELGLSPHPEGGYFKESYRANLKVPIDDTRATLRDASTAIYFLLKGYQVSHLHRIKSDEIWHFYLGSPLEILEIDEHGELVITCLGQDWQGQEQFQYTVKAHRWFGSRLKNPQKDSFALVGCTVAPGFDFRDFEMAKLDDVNDILPAPLLDQMILNPNPHNSAIIP